MVQEAVSIENVLSHLLRLVGVNCFNFLVSAQLKKEDIDFFPTNKALCLENIEESSDQQLDRLMEMVGRLVQRIEREVRYSSCYVRCYSSLLDALAEKCVCLSSL